MRYAHIRNGVCYTNKTNNRWTAKPFTPSTNANQAYPIILEEGIHVNPVTYGPASRYIGRWTGIIGFHLGNGEHLFEVEGPTPLIAAMRCYAISALGDEIEFNA